MTDLHRVLEETTQLIRAGRYSDAQVVLEAALPSHPVDGRLLRKLAWTHLHLNDQSKANAILNRLDRRSGHATATRPQLGPSLAPPRPRAAIDYDHDQLSPADYLALIERTDESPTGHASHVSAIGGYNTTKELAHSSEADNEVNRRSLSEASIDMPDSDETVRIEVDEAPVDSEQAGALLPETSSAFEDVSAALTRYEPASLESVWSLELEVDGNSDEINEVVHSLRADPVELVERRVRATQQARELLASHGYDTRRHVREFTDLFFRFGWSKCKATVADYLKRGYSPEEIYLAFRVRMEWAGCAEFTDCVYSTWNGERRCYPGAAILGWGLALSIIRAFDGLPTLSELRMFLDREFGAWSSSPTLQEDYKSFSQYLAKYRLDDSGRNLPPSEQRHFEHSPDTIGFDPEWDDHMGHDPIPNATGRDLLLALVDRCPMRDNLFDRC